MTKEESNKIDRKIEKVATKLFDVIEELGEDGGAINNIDISLNALVRLLAIRIVYRGDSLSSDLELFGDVVEKLLVNIQDVRRKKDLILNVNVFDGFSTRA